jgi:hypothetical protein
MNLAYWALNTAGIGSILVLVVGISVLVGYAAMLRWIWTAPPDPRAGDGQDTPPRGEPA